MRPIYLDYNATTPIAASVVEAMLPFLNTHFGNPSSNHLLGRIAHEAVEESRNRISLLLGCDSNEIVFTSCGTESNNLAVKGVMMRGFASSHEPGEGTGSRGHLIVSAIEHAAVMEPALYLKKLGYELTVVPCDHHGVVSPASVERAIQPNTRLVSVMHANNEIGTLQPISRIGELCHERNILFHTDACQSVGKIPTSVEDLNVDLLSLAGHKMYAPKGIGALFVRNGVMLEPLFHGASQEHGVRSGTLNTPYIVALGQAAKLVSKGMDESMEGIARLRDRLQKALVQGIKGLVVNGGNAARLPNTLSVSFPEVSGFEMLKRCSELCASLGTACHSHADGMSATLKAMGCSAEHARGTIRFSLGWNSNQEEIDKSANSLIDAWERLTQ